MLDAEALLFVDDEKPEVLEVQVVGQQPMRADDDVDGAVLHAAHDLGLFLRRQEPRQHLDPYRIVREPLAEGLAVLACEQRGRYEDRDLFAVMTALSAARSATSVLPNPTSPQTRRSIGIGRSMSFLVSTMA